MHARVFDRAGSVGRSHIAPDRVAFRLHDAVGIPDQYSVGARWLAVAASIRNRQMQRRMPPGPARAT